MLTEGSLIIAKNFNNLNADQQGTNKLRFSIKSNGVQVYTA